VEHKVYGKIKSFGCKMVMSVIVTGLYRFETPLKTDTCFHSYKAYDTAVGAARVESYRLLQSSFIGQYHMWSPNCLILSFLLRLFSVLGYACFPCLKVTGLVKVSNVSEEPSASIFMVEE
jgi:hypothetical protein